MRLKNHTIATKYREMTSPHVTQPCISLCLDHLKKDARVVTHGKWFEVVFMPFRDFWHCNRAAALLATSEVEITFELRSERGQLP